MSFEQHPIVAAHLDKLEGRELDIVNFQVFLLEKLSKALYEELIKYQEQEALRQTQIDPLSKAKTENSIRTTTSSNSARPRSSIRTISSTSTTSLRRKYL